MARNSPLEYGSRRVRGVTQKFDLSVSGVPVIARDVFRYNRSTIRRHRRPPPHSVMILYTGGLTWISMIFIYLFFCPPESQSRRSHCARKSSGSGTAHGANWICGVYPTHYMCHAAVWRMLVWRFFFFFLSHTHTHNSRIRFTHTHSIVTI